MACTDFTNDFYKLVNIRSNSSRSLFSYQEGQTDDEDDEDDDEDDDDEQDSSMSESQVKARNSPTPSEAGRAQLTSCSSSETDEHSMTHPVSKQQQIVTEQAVVEETEEEAAQDEEEEEHDYAVIEECREMALANQSVINEQQCIAQIIKTELRRPPHVLVKSKSVLEDQEPSCILRHNQRRELESSVVRSDSISCALMAKMAKETSISLPQPPPPPAPAVVSKLKERLLQRHAAMPSTPTPTANSWRRSNGWKRVTSPVQAAALVSPTKKVGKLWKILVKIALKECTKFHLIAAGNKVIGVAKELPQGAAHTNSDLHTHILLVVDLIQLVIAVVAVAANDNAAEASNTAATAAATQIQNSTACSRASFLCQLRDASLSVLPRSVSRCPLPYNLEKQTNR